MLSIDQRPKGFDSTQMFTKPKQDPESSLSSEIDDDGNDQVKDLPSRRSNRRPKLSKMGSVELDS